MKVIRACPGERLLYHLRTSATRFPTAIDTEVGGDTVGYAMPRDAVVQL